MPILSEEAFRKTEAIVQKFLEPNGIGELLQAILLETSNQRDNWAYDWWLSDMYMLNKLPLPINSNPGMIFPREQFTDDDAQLKFTARLISGIMDYKIVIDEKVTNLNNKNILVKFNFKNKIYFHTFYTKNDTHIFLKGK